jgi:vanillate O-demethylase ferredoxin subunit
MATDSGRLLVRVAAIRHEAPGIKSYLLIDAAGGELPPFTAGAHVLVDLSIGVTRQYSICNDPTETHRYVIGVLREPNGRGGSAFMHDRVSVGDQLSISPPRNNFPLAEGARESLLIAGGIGITPILAMCRELHRRGAPFTLHYCTRSPEVTAFSEELAAAPFTARIRFHHDGGDPSRGLDVRGLLTDFRDGMHVYCCGPAGLMRAVQDATGHWPSGQIHFEFFNAAEGVTLERAGDTAFEVVLASTGRTFVVQPGRSILEVLRDHGIIVESLCQEGICGTCITKVLEGVPDHRDSVLDDMEKSQNKLIAVCCSRSRSPRLVLEL